MSKIFTSLGLIGGTSGDGIDASLVNLMVLMNQMSLRINILNTFKYL